MGVVTCPEWGPLDSDLGLGPKAPALGRPYVMTGECINEDVTVEGIEGWLGAWESCGVRAIQGPVTGNTNSETYRLPQREDSLRVRASQHKRWRWPRWGLP